MIVDLAETLGESDLLLRGDLLVSEEHHQVLQPSGLDLGERLAVDMLQIDAADLSTKRAGEWLDLDSAIGRHGVPPGIIARNRQDHGTRRSVNEAAHPNPNGRHAASRARLPRPWRRDRCHRWPAPMRSLRPSASVAG